MYFLSLHVIVRMYSRDVHTRHSFDGRPTEVNRSLVMDYMRVEIYESNSTLELCGFPLYIWVLTGCSVHYPCCAVESTAL
jgi:hypothetical protein